MANATPSLRRFCEYRNEISEADQVELQEKLNRIAPRFAPDIRDVLRSRLRAFFELVANHGGERDAGRARSCLLRFDDTDVVTLQRCARTMDDATLAA